jgi:hypothetical protein
MSIVHIAISMPLWMVGKLHIKRNPRRAKAEFAA